MYSKLERVWKHGSYATAAGGLLMVAFWLVYFVANDAVGLVDASHREFEEAFVAADAVLAFLLFRASWALRHTRSEGPFLLAVAAAMTLYLGILDTTFYTRAGRFTAFDADALVQGAINLVLIGGGIYGLWAAWIIGRRS